MKFGVVILELFWASSLSLHFDFCSVALRSLRRSLCEEEIKLVWGNIFIFFVSVCILKRVSPVEPVLAVPNLYYNKFRVWNCGNCQNFYRCSLVLFHE